MTSDLHGGAGREPGEGPIELRRYLEALRRGLPLTLSIVVILGLTTYLVSLSLTKHYRAEAVIVRQQLTPADKALSVDSLTRELNTLNGLLNSDGTLRAAAAKLRGETEQSLRKRVSSRVDPNANLINVTATASDPVHAASVANVVAQTFLAREATLERHQAELARGVLQEELGRFKAQPNSTQQVQTVQAQLSNLNIQIAAGAELALAQRATPPTSPVTPHPARNLVLAVVLGLLIGAVVALVRDQLTPRPTSADELSRLLGLPLLVAVPRVRLRGLRGRGARQPSERDSYRVLANAIRYWLPAEDAAQLVLVVSAVDGEGKTTVAAGLARALEDGGDPVLLAPYNLPGEARGARSTTDFGDLLKSARGEGNGYVVVDGPALLGTVEGPASVAGAPNVLYVARLDRVTLEQVINARDLLDRLECRPIGLVVLGSSGQSSAPYVRARVAALEDL